MTEVIVNKLEQPHRAEPAIEKSAATDQPAPNHRMMRGKHITSSAQGQGSGNKASMRERKKKQEDELFEQTILPTGVEVSKQMWQLVEKANLEKFLCDLLQESQAVHNQHPQPSAFDGLKNDKLTFGPQSPRSSDDIVTPIFEKASSMKLAPSFEPDNQAEHKDIPLLRAFSEQPHEQKHSTSGFSFTKINQTGISAGPFSEVETGFSRFGSQKSDKKSSPVAQFNPGTLESVAKNLVKQLDTQGLQ